MKSREQLKMEIKIRKIDNIPNEDLKNSNCIRLLYTFFKFCFTNSLTPDEWLQAIISPIPETADSEPHIPLKCIEVQVYQAVSFNVYQYFK